MQPRSKVRRRVFACARCRKRKLACDGKSPACSRCVEAGLECAGFNSATQGEAPRSIARYLEAHIAKLEKRSPQTDSSQTPSARPKGKRRIAFAHSLASSVLDGITPSFLGITDTMAIARCVVVGTRPPSTKNPYRATDLDENHPRSIMNPSSPPVSLHSIPANVAEFLCRNYILGIIPQYPIYHNSLIIEAFNCVYNTSAAHQQEATPYQEYVISLVMAISLTTAARNKQARAIIVAAGLFRTAAQRFGEIATNDLSGLQALLLVTQYAFMNPSVANLWLLTGLTSQACIDFGLHQELPDDPHVSEYERDTRRRIFWCAWEIEIAVCGALHRPISIPPTIVDVAFPSTIDDGFITEDGIDSSARETKRISHCIWRFRIIEAEVLTVLYQKEPLPGGYSSLTAWVEHIETAIMDWHQDVHRSAVANSDDSLLVKWKEMSLYSDIALPYTFLLLHRPTPLIKEPAKENLMKAFISSVQVATGYWDQFNEDFGRIKYVFHPCHHVFTSAIVFLEALQRCKVEVSDLYTLPQVEEYMAAFSRVFSGIMERWPAASRCLEEYERLLEPIQRDYKQFLDQKAKSTPSTSQANYHVANPMNNDENINFWNIFNPTALEGGDIGGPGSQVPLDWDGEFNFGMEDLESIAGSGDLPQYDGS